MNKALTLINLSLTSVGSHEKTSLVQHPPQRLARVQVGQTVMSGSGCLGKAMVISRGLQASNTAISALAVAF